MGNMNLIIIKTNFFHDCDSGAYNISVIRFLRVCLHDIIPPVVPTVVFVPFRLNSTLRASLRKASGGQEVHHHQVAKSAA